MREEREESRQPAGRSKRVPLGVPRTKLNVPSRKGYVRRFINDHPGRLEAALNAGYAFVEDKSLHVGQEATSGDSDLGSRVSRSVGTNDDGSPLRAYLMEIQQKYYDEDAAEKQAKVDVVDNAIKHGTLDGVETDGQYVPKGGGIKYRQPKT